MCVWREKGGSKYESLRMCVCVVLICMYLPMLV